MKRFSQQFNTTAKRVKLTKAESRELKERLVAYMEYHPLPDAHRAVSTTTPSEESFWLVQFNTARNRIFVGMTALVALIIVPFAAEQSVPGDVLYPVKVQFNEEIRSSLALTPYQKVEWETARVERRLAEARLLATEGKLTEAVEAEVAKAVKQHGEAAQAGLAQLRETDQDEAAIAELSFASSLEVESEVLEQAAARQAAAGASTTAQLAAAVADVRARVATPETTDVSFDRLLARVEEETTHASELLYSLRNEITKQEQEDIDRRLADIGRKMELALRSRATSTVADAPVASTDITPSATTSTSTTATTSTTTTAAQPTQPPVIDEPTAKQYLREALRDAQKLVRFMTDIEVKGSVSVDELVPVSLTEAERLTQLAQQRTAIADLVRQLELKDTTDEKVAFGLARIAELTTQASSAEAVGNLDRAETAVAEARALLDDMIKATDMLPSRAPAPSATTTEATADVDEPERAATTSDPVAATSTTATTTSTDEGLGEAI